MLNNTPFLEGRSTDLRAKCKKKLDRLEKQGYNIFGISKYASDAYDKGFYDETVTEYKVQSILGRDG